MNIGHLHDCGWLVLYELIYAMTECIEYSNDGITLSIDGKSIKFIGKRVHPIEEPVDWIIYTNIIYDVEEQEYVFGHISEYYLNALKDCALLKEWVLDFDSAKALTVFSEKLRRFFEWGGPGRKVTNFDMGLAAILAITMFVIVAVVDWLVN